MFLLPLLFACSIPGPGAVVPLPAGDPNRPDIVLISIDTLRADHLSSYGHTRETSPFLDTLAADGARFAHSRSASPWTLPAHTTMLTGQLPATHMVVDDTLALDPNTPVLPELLQKGGFATGGFVATLYVSRVFGFERGFDRFEDFELHTEKKNLSGEVRIDHVVDAALEWWAERPAGEPVFLFLHSYDVHYDYNPPGTWSWAFDRGPMPWDPKYKNYAYYEKNTPTQSEFEHQLAQYDEAIRFVDAQIQRLAESAAASGRKVQFVITADHGEEFGERGSWGHAHTLYSEQLHVPLIVSGPGIPAGKVIEGTVGTQDVAPTILGLAGLSSGLQADGIDLGPLLQGAPIPERAFPAETTRFKTNRLSLYEAGYRLEWDLKENRQELFETSKDPKEADDLSATQPDALRHLAGRAEEVLGRPWLVEVEGEITVQQGVILMGGQKGRKLAVSPGDRFLVLPYDASVTFQRLGSSVGPFQAAAGTLPGPGACIRYEGTARAGTTQLSDDQRQLLIELGYIQPDAAPEAAPAAAPVEAPTGPCAPS